MNNKNITNAEDDEKYAKLIKVYGIDVDKLLQDVRNIQEIPQLMGGLFQFSTRKNILPMDAILSEAQDVNCWVKKINHLTYGINISLNEAINVIKQEGYRYFPFSKNTKDQECYYHIENAEFRLIGLWDILAQLYKLYFKLIGEVRSVNYKKIFTNKNIKKININRRYKINDNEEINKIFQEGFSKICNYIIEEVGYDEKTLKCLGNHKYLSEDRNSFIHRNNPHEFLILNSENKQMSLPDASLHIINRLVEDYIVVYNFLYQIIRCYWDYFQHYGIKL